MTSINSTTNCVVLAKYFKVLKWSEKTGLIEKNGHAFSFEFNENRIRFQFNVE